jgi:molybdopterin biosynthesis enzyme MoaB
MPDEVEAIQAQVRVWARHPQVPGLVLLTGGTGFAPRNVTPEAIRPLLNEEEPGNSHGHDFPMLADYAHGCPDASRLRGGGPVRCAD